MKEFTPGPWRIASRKNDDDFSTDDIMTDSEPSRRVCNVYGGTIDETGLANARLIAAAPEMLQMLDKCLTHLDGCSHGYSDELWAGIEAVIAKARGEINV